MIKLTEISRPKQWKTISGKMLKDSGYPVYGANGKIGFYDKYTHENPTVLITCRGATCGSINISEPKSYVNGNAMALDNLSDSYSLKFLYYILKARGLNDVISGSAQPQITRTNLNSVLIPNPPLKTQQKIAAILDEADKLRRLNKKLLKKYEQLSQSLFLEMFGDPIENKNNWKKEKLENICEVGSSRRVFVKELVKDGIPFFRGTEIGQLSRSQPIDPSLFITRSHYEKLKEKVGVPEIGDLLMPSICPDGRIWRVPNNDPFYFKDGRVLWIKVNELKINSIYLKAFLKELFRTDYHNIASGTTFAELKIFALKKIDINMPPLNFQNQYSDSIKEIERQRTQAHHALEDSEKLFNSLMQRAFKGELVKE